MALDIKKFGVRALSAVAFVAVLLFSMLFSYLSFSIFFFVVALWGLIEFYKIAQALGFEPYQKTGMLAATFLYLVCIQWSLLSEITIDLSKSIYVLLIFPFFILVSSVFDKKPNPFTNALFTLAGLVYAVIPFTLLHLIVTNTEASQMSFEPKRLLGIILLIWSNDTFAYLGGSIFGKHKMIERVSPGKTWEGTIIGVLITFGLSFLIAPLLGLPNSHFWALVGALVPILATLGDLLESVIKRQAAIKDTGNVLPGHGGILDRFDSLIFVAPFALLILKIIA